MTQLVDPGTPAAAPLLTRDAAALRASSASLPLPPPPAPAGANQPEAAGRRAARHGLARSRDSHGWWHGIARGSKAAAAAAGLVIALAVAAAAAGYITFPHAAVFRRLDAQSADWLIPAVALAAIIAAITAWQGARRLLEGRKAANVLTVIAATVATGVSSTGMWQFFTVYVPTLDTLIRIPIFAFLEIAVLSEALLARDNMRDFGASGIDGLAMWALTGTSAFLASLASTTIAEALFRLAPPLVAAWLWERTLVSERRRRPERGDNDPLTWRISAARILVRLGLAEPAGRTIEAVAAQRRITTLALAANRLAALEADGAAAWRQRRADRKLRAALTAAVEHAGLAVDAMLQRQLVDEIAVLTSHRELAGLRPATPWAELAAQDRRDDDRRDDDRRDDDRRDDDRRDDDRRDDASYSALAAELSRAARTPDPQGSARLHELLADRSDYPALVIMLGRLARDGKPGAKRLMYVTALYATGASSPAAVAAWIAGIVPGQAGRADKAEIRRVRDRLAPYWRVINYRDNCKQESA